MSTAIDPKEIAARILGILGGQDQGMIEATARRLGVSEVALRITVDRDEPHPTVEVIAAVAQTYGVDPIWLLCGEYDPGAHRAAVADEASIARGELTRIIARRLAIPPNASLGDLRLEA